MTIKEVFYTVSDLARHLAKEKVVTVDAFNRYAKMAQLEHAEDLFQRMKTTEGQEEYRILQKALLPYYTSSGSSLASQTTYCTLTLPSKLWHFDRLQAGGKPIELVTRSERIERSNNAVTAPTTDLPIAEIHPTVFHIYPDISSYSTGEVEHYAYLDSQEEPVIVMSQTGGIDVVNESSSVDFVLGDEYHFDLIMKILGYLNIPISKESALSYIEQKQEP